MSLRDKQIREVLDYDVFQSRRVFDNTIKSARAMNESNAQPRKSELETETTIQGQVDALYNSIKKLTGMLPIVQQASRITDVKGEYDLKMYKDNLIEYMLGEGVPISNEEVNYILRSDAEEIKNIVNHLVNNWLTNENRKLMSMIDIEDEETLAEEERKINEKLINLRIGDSDRYVTSKIWQRINAEEQRQGSNPSDIRKSEREKQERKSAQEYDATLAGIVSQYNGIVNIISTKSRDAGFSKGSIEFLTSMLKKVVDACKEFLSLVSSLRVSNTVVYTKSFGIIKKMVDLIEQAPPLVKMDATLLSDRYYVGQVEGEFEHQRVGQYLHNQKELEENLMKKMEAAKKSGRNVDLEMRELSRADRLPIRETAREQQPSQPGFYEAPLGQRQLPYVPEYNIPSVPGVQGAEVQRITGMPQQQQYSELPFTTGPKTTYDFPKDKKEEPAGNYPYTMVPTKEAKDLVKFAKDKKIPIEEKLKKFNEHKWLRDEAFGLGNPMKGNNEEHKMKLLLSPGSLLLKFYKDQGIDPKHFFLSGFSETQIDQQTTGPQRISEGQQVINEMDELLQPQQKVSSMTPTIPPDRANEMRGYNQTLQDKIKKSKDWIEKTHTMAVFPSLPSQPETPIQEPEYDEYDDGTYYTPYHNFDYNTPINVEQMREQVSKTSSPALKKIMEGEVRRIDREQAQAREAEERSKFPSHMTEIIKKKRNTSKTRRPTLQPIPEIDGYGKPRRLLGGVWETSLGQDPEEARHISNTLSQRASNNWLSSKLYSMGGYPYLPIKGDNTMGRLDELAQRSANNLVEENREEEDIEEQPQAPQQVEALQAQPEGRGRKSKKKGEVKMSKKSFTKEHKNLIGLLSNTSGKLGAEAKDQLKEMKKVAPEDALQVEKIVKHTTKKKALKGGAKKDNKQTATLQFDEKLNDVWFM